MRGEVFLVLLSLAVVKTEISQNSILNYEKYTIPDINFVCLNFNIIANISEKCGEQLEVVCSNSTLLLTMLDATSKFPYSGLGYESRIDFGNYDQCMTVDHKYEGGRILGKHCIGGYIIPDILGDATDITSAFLLTLCKPDACSAEDYTAIIGKLIGDVPILFQDAYCQTIETGTDITAADIVTIVICAIIILFMILSTVYDIYLYKTQSDSRHPLYTAFSVLSNGRKLFQVTKNSNDQIQTFHGLKAISMMWIVAGHEFQMLQYSSVINLADTLNWVNNRYTGYITTAPISVDTFFFISGYLLAFQYLKQKAKPLRDQLISVPQMYLYRYIRLTPALFMLFLVTISIYKHIGSGPLWTVGAERDSDVCTKNWWPLFIYLQNFIVDSGEEACLPHTWYLAADMQMFVLAPLVLIPLSLYVRRPSGFTMSMLGLLILNLIFIALPIILLLEVRDYNHDSKFYARIISYFIGMMLAVFMRIKQDKPFLYMVKSTRKPVVNLIIWIIILLGMLVLLISSREVQMNGGYESKSVFSSLMRPAWCIGLSWIVYSCHHGYGGIVNWILSGSIMQVLGKLTYCIYLIHFSIIKLQYLSLHNKVYFSDYNAFYLWCGHFTVSTLVAIFWTLAFESPLIIIERYFLRRGPVQSKRPQTVNEDVETNKKSED